MHVGGFHAVPGRCRGLQGLAGASKGLQGAPGAFGGSRDLEGPPKPPKTQQKHRFEQRGFLKGSERPEAGCLGEYNFEVYLRQPTL